MTLNRSPLALDLVGDVTEVVASDEVVPARPGIKRLRASHHGLARLLARGVSPESASFQTDYSLATIRSLASDPSFRRLVEHYRVEHRDVEVAAEEKFLALGMEARDVLHERLIEDSDSVPTAVALEIFKAAADRGGFAPVSRSVNKNLNVNIGARLDAARARVRSEGQNDG